MARSVLGTIVWGFVVGVVVGIMVWAVVGCILLMLTALSPRPIVSLFFVFLVIVATLSWLIQTHPWTAAIIYGTMFLIAVAVSWGQPTKDAFNRSFIVGILSIPPAVYVSLMIGLVL